MRPTILVNVYDWKILMTRETEQLISAICAASIYAFEY